MLGAVWKMFPFSGQLREKVGGVRINTLHAIVAGRSRSRAARRVAATLPKQRLLCFQAGYLLTT